MRNGVQLPLMPVVEVDWVMLRWLGRFAVLGSLSFACAANSDDGAAGGGGTTSCVPGKVEECPCPGVGPKGTQICAADGKSFGECTGCGSGGGGGWPSGGAAGSGAAGSGATGGASGGGGGTTGGSGGPAARRVRPIIATTASSTATRRRRTVAAALARPVLTRSPDCVESPKRQRFATIRRFRSPRLEAICWSA
jgi:hypothetical protein